jgi:hypothetical protein
MFAATIQDPEFASQVMLQVGLPLDELQTVTASPVQTDSALTELLLKYPPHSLSYWQKLKWQWLVRQGQIATQLLQPGEEVANTSLVKQLRSQAQFHCAVAIVNATSQAGLASKVATVLENGGKRVVQITNAASGATTSEVFYGSEACAGVANDVAVVTPTQSRPQSNSSLSLQYRSDVIIVLGTDVAGLN